MTVVVDSNAYVRSRFQKFASEKVIDHLKRLPEDMKIYACYEFPLTDKKYGWKGGKPKSQDLHVEIILPYRSTICFEMKSTSHDLASGYGMNFVETFNFICFPERAKSFSNQMNCSNLREYAIRKRVPEHVGILMVKDNGEISCLRESRSKDGRLLVFGNYECGGERVKLVSYKDGVNLK